MKFLIIMISRNKRENIKLALEIPQNAADGYIVFAFEYHNLYF